jgi:hypothetical protein
MVSSSTRAAVGAVRNSDRQLLEVLKVPPSPGAPYWSKLNGWKPHEKVGTGVPAAAAADTMSFAKSLRFYCSAYVADPPGFLAACRRRAATREDRVVMTIAVQHSTGFEGDCACKHANRAPGCLSL